jgi:ankyrin repeat protein
MTLGQHPWATKEYPKAYEINSAAKRGDVEKVTALLKASPDLVSSKGVDGETPLHGAAINGHRALAELLLAKGAKVNATDNNGWSPLFLASRNGHRDVAELLRQHGGHE